jgi:hypothetical protein
MPFRHYLTTNFNRRPALWQVQECRRHEEQVQGWRAQDVFDMTSLLRHVPWETNETKKNISQDGVNLSEFAVGNNAAQFCTEPQRSQLSHCLLFRSGVSNQGQFSFNTAAHQLIQQHIALFLWNIQNKIRPSPPNSSTFLYVDAATCFGS